MQLPVKSPAKQLNLSKVAPETHSTFMQILRLIEEIHFLSAKVVNFNELTYVSQNAQPTPEEGKTMIWRDADAGVGTPKAYIVTTQNGETFTFASEELA